MVAIESLYIVEESFAPNILENKNALELLWNAIGKADYLVTCNSHGIIAFRLFRSGKYDLNF